MFIVFNKAKINSYLISIGTVIMLFSMTFMLNKNMDTVETSTVEQQIDNVSKENLVLILNSDFQNNDDNVININ